jgi:hypothetical protein
VADESGVTVRVFLSHDVDWSRRGPALDHVLARRDRFDEEILRRALEEGFNPYFGIPDVMEVEERLGLRSTFFFRSVYDDGLEVSCYEDVIRDLVSFDGKCWIVERGLYEIRVGPPQGMLG